MNEPLLTVKDYQDAMDVQGACNLSGVVRSFREVTQKMWNMPQADTNYVNRHPISRLYAEQVSHLTGGGMADNNTYHSAYKRCLDVINGSVEP